MKTIKWLSILAAGFIIQIIVSYNITVIGNLNATDVIEIEKHKFDGDLIEVDPFRDRSPFECDPFYDFEIVHNDKFPNFIKDKRNNEIIESVYGSLRQDPYHANQVHEGFSYWVPMGPPEDDAKYHLFSESALVKETFTLELCTKDDGNVEFRLLEHTKNIYPYGQGE